MTDARRRELDFQRRLKPGMTFHERFYAFYRANGHDHAEAHRHAAADVKWWREEVFGIKP